MATKQESLHLLGVYKNTSDGLGYHSLPKLTPYGFHLDIYRRMSRMRGVQSSPINHTEKWLSYDQATKFKWCRLNREFELRCGDPSYWIEVYVLYME